jgi:hypothetical protein
VTWLSGGRCKLWGGFRVRKWADVERLAFV